MDRALIHQGAILPWEELSGLPRGIPESQRRQGSKEDNLLGQRFVRMRREGGAEPFSLMHSPPLGTQRSLPSLVSFHGWRELGRDSE